MIRNLISKLAKKAIGKVVKLPRFPLIQIDEKTLSPEAKEVYDGLLEKLSLSDVIKSELEYQTRYGGLFVDVSKNETTLKRGIQWRSKE